jgi:hypothetical protein
MGLLEAASNQDIKRLLELFPVAVLREKWSGLEGTKEELCVAVAEKRDYPDIAKFVDEHFSCCKQHISIFSDAKLPAQLPELKISEGEKILEAKTDGVQRRLHLIRSEYTVILRDPLVEAKLHFLWPVRVDFTKDKVILRFVVLEKNIGSYFDGRSYYVSSRSIDEDAVLHALKDVMGADLIPTDLHKGVKKLWEEGFMDSSRAQYKKSISTASETMDEDKRIKQDNPALYETLLESPLFNTMFEIPPRKNFTVSFLC